MSRGWYRSVEHDLTHFLLIEWKAIDLLAEKCQLISSTIKWKSTFYYCGSFESLFWWTFIFRSLYTRICVLKFWFFSHLNFDNTFMVIFLFSHSFHMIRHNFSWETKNSKRTHIDCTQMDRQTWRNSTLYLLFSCDCCSCCCFFSLSLFSNNIQCIQLISFYCCQFIDYQDGWKNGRHAQLFIAVKVCVIAVVSFTSWLPLEKNHKRSKKKSKMKKKMHHNNSWVIIDNNMTIKTPMQSNMDQLNSEIILPCRLSSLKFCCCCLSARQIIECTYLFSFITQSVYAAFLCGSHAKTCITQFFVFFY